MTKLNPHSVEIDLDRLQRERSADADILSSLRSQGDSSFVRRSIDLRFIGKERDIFDLRDKASDWGFRPIQVVENHPEGLAIDLAYFSDTTEASIDTLTIMALKIEKLCGVKYDGWGTVVTS